MQTALQARGIHTGIHYPTPGHLLPARQDLGYKTGQFAHSKQAAAEVLSLPMYPELTASMQQEVVAAVLKLHERLDVRGMAPDCTWQAIDLDGHILPEGPHSERWRQHNED